jgi:hypothetical protein
VSSIKRTFFVHQFPVLLNLLKSFSCFSILSSNNYEFFISIKSIIIHSLHYLTRCLLTNGQLPYSLIQLFIFVRLTILLSMENSSSSPRKGELVESMFKSLNSYTSELQQGSFVCLFFHIKIKNFSLKN